MYMWREFDIGEVRDEFAQIADIGFDVVRVLAMTQDFLPGPLSVAPEMVGRLVEVARAAEDVGLQVVPTLIVLNMSGQIWWPDWMLDAAGRPGDLFADPLLLRSQALLVERCATALAGASCVRAFDLSNEIDDAQRPGTRHSGWLHASLLANSVRRVAPGIPIQIGAHLPSLTTQNNMRIDDLAGVADEDIMHAYPLYYDGARSFLDPELVPFSCALTAALSGTGRRALMQEFGLCSAPPGATGQSITDDFLGTPRLQYLASEEEGATYYDQVLERLVASGAAGAYAWCYGDYDPTLFDRPPLARAIRERTFGLVRADGSEKPAAAVFRAWRKRRDAGTLVRHSEDAGLLVWQPGDPDPIRRQSAASVLDVSADEYYAAPALHFARLYLRWLSQNERLHHR